MLHGPGLALTDRTARSVCLSVPRFPMKKATPSPPPRLSTWNSGTNQPWTGTQPGSWPALHSLHACCSQPLDRIPQLGNDKPLHRIGIGIDWLRVCNRLARIGPGCMRARARGRRVHGRRDPAALSKVYSLHNVTTLLGREIRSSVFTLADCN